MIDSNPRRRLESGRALLWCGLLVLSGAALAGSAAMASDPAVGDTQPDQISPWLDEVRAQREAWEARRSAAREQHEQRRRLHHPRSAAQQATWEEDLRRRRAERQERIEQDREAFIRPEPPGLYPPGWNNLWYFRGY
ncbi:hypothetical protein [Allochromatium palmeri]|uniref:DUF3106 domain-containing protein n=1 Tax=Allochromatium palmeri TaxID=231048 RepID=A0A6N8EBP6_9GAMM|nr:hypothetical protein [Allochromatium palmeri]MTW19957.1 hypothetical protein [Allochromatium palmeri]